MSDEIRAVEAPFCILCGEPGRILYSGLRDRLFAAPGVWSLMQCPDARCSLIWLNPVPTPDEVHKAYANYYTHFHARSRSRLRDRIFAAAKHGYVANHFGYQASLPDRVLGLLPWVYPGRAAELDFSVMWLEGRSRGRLLDVGAGSGWLVEHMNALGWQAEGLDFDRQALAAARAKGLKMHSGGLPEQRFAEASFDALTMSHSIEHVHDPVGWLAEARRVLKPGGRLTVATPNARSLLHRRFRSHWFSLEPPRHLHIFNRAALATVLRKANFTRFRIFTSARDAKGVFLASRAIRARGCFDMAQAQPGLKQLWARSVQLVELAVLLFDRDAGEDLVAIAER